MPDRLVHLQRELLAAEDDRVAAGGAGRRGEELEDLLAHARGVAGEVEREHALPAAGPTSPPCALG